MEKLENSGCNGPAQTAQRSAAVGGIPAQSLEDEQESDSQLQEDIIDALEGVPSVNHAGTDVAASAVRERIMATIKRSTALDAASVTVHTGCGCRSAGVVQLAARGIAKRLGASASAR